MRYLILLLALIGSDRLYANNYYFSMSAGDDSRSAAEAQNPSTPWRTLDKLNSIIGMLNPGDFVFFSRNDVFEGSIVITRSGTSALPITFGAYGSGAKPVISGLSTFSNWTSTGNGTWESPSPASSRVNVVLLNHIARPIGRWPNRDAANSGYLNYEGYSGNTQITDNDLPGYPNWTGGEVVIRKVRWVIDRSVITQHSGNTIHYNSESHYGASYKHGYFIQNHPATLDIPGEWYYKLNERKLGIYSPSGDPSGSLVEGSTRDSLISVIGQSNINFDNLSLIGANINAFNFINTQSIRITDCDINHSGLNAINGLNANDLTVENSTIDHTNNTALNLVDCSYLTARNNKIKNTGMIAGMGKGDAGAYEAILVNGDNETIEQNEIENTGYIPITFRGNVNIIRNNYINNFAMVKDDASGIYTWNNIPNSPATYGTKITGNLILNGIGAGDGTEHPDYFPANGIYMDDNTANVEITGNTVANCGLFGMYIHNARNITITNNTLFNNVSQIVFRQDQHSSAPIRGIVLKNNVLFSKTGNQLTAEFSSETNDLGDHGISDNNYHVRPLDPGNIIYASYHSNGSFYGNAVTLDTWKGMFGKDIHSQGTPVTISSPDLIRFEYNPTFSSKSIPLDGTYIDARSNTYNGSITLGPLSGAALIKTADGPPTHPLSGLNYRYYEGDWDWTPN
ncbi:MAG TPA: right-handed parallel beta-helix repeat-containing protein, partial [Chitinophagaceae bacterium]|nr:right-handed parallel beta-helix repeat-containing protein [Chitinophagaceae bacterium]